MGKRLYDGLRFVALIVLPAISAMYFGAGNIWDFPEVEKVIGTIAVLDTVLGGVIATASAEYFKKATVAEVAVGLDEHGAAEIRGVKQLSDEPLIFDDGNPMLMRVNFDRTPPEDHLE